MEVFLALATLVAMVCLVVHLYVLNQRWNAISREEHEAVRRAAELSISASNTVSPIIALVDVSGAVQIMEFLHRRYGHPMLSSICGVDTLKVLRRMKNQKLRIVQDIATMCPEIKPSHPLTNLAGYDEGAATTDECRKE